MPSVAPPTCIGVNAHGQNTPGDQSARVDDLPVAYVGIDPGLSGGIALITENHAETYKMPETDRDILDLLIWLSSKFDLKYALLERALALPAAVEARLGIQRGPIATAKLVGNYRAVRMALTAINIQFGTVSAAKWQRDLGCLTKGDKNVTKERAQQLFPCIKVTHAVADALLIAYYARHDAAWKDTQTNQ